MLIGYARVGSASQSATDNASKTAGRRRIFTPTTPAPPSTVACVGGRGPHRMAPGPGWAEVCTISSRRWPSLSARVSSSEPYAGSIDTITTGGRFLHLPGIDRIRNERHHRQNGRWPAGWPQNAAGPQRRPQPLLQRPRSRTSLMMRSSTIAPTVASTIAPTIPTPR
jgi:hypothetical protein